MAKLQAPYQTQTGITSANYTTKFIKVDPNALPTITATPTVAGAPSAVYLEYTVDRHEIIDAGTAIWVTDYASAKAAAFGDTARGSVTGVRLNVSASGGTWTLSALQAHNAILQP